MKKTKLQKLDFTFETQYEKAKNELLGDLYHDEKYEGVAAIVWNYTVKKTETAIEFRVKKIPAVPPKREKNTVYFILAQGKGAKQI
jgi:hypothetical protein